MESNPVSDRLCQTSTTSEFPPLNSLAHVHQTRTTEKGQLTKLLNKINERMLAGGTDIELTSLRRQLGERLNDCTEAHDAYIAHPNYVDPTDRDRYDWIRELEKRARMCYRRVDRYVTTQYARGCVGVLARSGNTAAVGTPAPTAAETGAIARRPITARAMEKFSDLLSRLKPLRPKLHGSTLAFSDCEPSIASERSHPSQKSMPAGWPHFPDFPPPPREDAASSLGSRSRIQMEQETQRRVQAEEELKELKAEAERLRKQLDDQAKAAAHERSRLEQTYAAKLESERAQRQQTEQHLNEELQQHFEALEEERKERKRAEQLSLDQVADLRREMHSTKEQFQHHMAQQQDQHRSEIDGLLARFEERMRLGTSAGSSATFPPSAPMPAYHPPRTETSPPSYTSSTSRYFSEFHKSPRNEGASEGATGHDDPWTSSTENRRSWVPGDDRREESSGDRTKDPPAADYKRAGTPTGSGTNEIPRRSLYRFPRMDLNPFDGNPKDWPNFIAAFKDMINSDPNYTTVQKMAALRACLKESVQNSLGDSLLNPDLYEEALEQLGRTYGNPYLVSRTYIKTLTTLPKVVHRSEYGKLLDSSNRIAGAVRSLKNSDYSHELQSSALLDDIVKKMPDHIKSSWGKQLVKNGTNPPLSLADFSDWLQKKVQAEMLVHHASFMDSSSQSNKDKSKKDGKRDQKTGRQNRGSAGQPPTVLHTSIDGNPSNPASTDVSTKQPVAPKNPSVAPSNPSQSRYCPLCDKTNHDLAGCKDFKDKNAAERGEIVKKYGICLRCLKKGHLKSDCSSKRNCGVDGCTYAHHTLLHGTPLIFKRKEGGTESKSAEKEKTDIHAIVTNTSTILPVVPVLISNGSVQLKTYALLDGGSEGTLILRSTADQLKLKGPVSSSRLATFHGNDPNIPVKMVNFSVSSLDQSSTFKVTSAYAVPTLSISSKRCNWKKVKSTWPYLSEIDFPSIESSQVTVLLGRDVRGVHDVLASRKPSAETDGPDAIQTPFGWCLVGPVPLSVLDGKAATSHRSTINKVSVIPSDEQLIDRLTQFWTTESMGVVIGLKPRTSEEDQRALDILNKTIRHTGERWEVGLMFKSDNFQLPCNRSAAARQLAILERRFQRDPDYARRYDKVIQEYISLGHAKLIEHPDSPQPKHEWYLPHHGVESKSGKLRVVFNCSARYQGVSINDMLMKGPDLLNNHIGILLRFRERPVAVVCDIEKMYHQVSVPESQQSVFRFLYRPPGSDQPPLTYQMTVHVFGAVSSPTACIFALRHTAETYKDLYPEAARILLDEAYVDNIIFSCETDDEAIPLAKDVKELSRKGGFNQRAFMSSSKNVLASLPAADLADPALNLNLDPLPTSSTLGVQWNCQTDELFFTYSVRIDVETMREILSQISSNYDPLGLICPVTLPMKILMQDLWRAGVGWDDYLYDSFLKTWQTWAKGLESLSSLKIQRCFRRRDGQPHRYELHVFCDASEAAFGACVYLRIQYGANDFESTLVFAKSRVAPIRQLTMPRLELQGSVVAVRIATIVSRDLTLPISSTTYWCDSSTVLSWIKSKTCKFHAFVANRVTEILDSSTADQWRHVPGILNPADDASRGLPASSLTEDCRWFTGPAFLSQTESSWPSFPSVAEPSPDDPEVTPVCWTGSIAVDDPHPILSLAHRTSSLGRFRRIVAWALRFIDRCRRRTKYKELRKWLYVTELNAASTVIIRADQLHRFRGEIIHLQVGKPLPAVSSLLPLTPFIDAEGVLRVGGRIARCPSVAESMKHPIILGANSRLAKLVIDDVHRAFKHASLERTISELRSTWYIQRFRSTVRTVLHRCLPCRKAKAEPAIPLMAALPPCRLQSHQPPFTFTGIDYFGPFEIVQGRSRIKRYGALFTCLVTRAVHIEIAFSLDTESFLMAFWRFAERRGYPSECCSDNGTNLSAGEKEIRSIIEEWNQERIASQLAIKNIQWRFNPPAAPHFGGAWERLVSSAKSALRTILNRRAVTDEVLSTAMVIVEGLLNGRPLTHVSVDPNEPEALTPNHFLLGRRNPNIHPAGLLGDDQVCLQRRFRAAQDIATHFWNRWIKEYLPDRIERRKWLGAARNLAVGDVVLVIENNARRGDWPLGIVTEVFPGSDAVVRSARVRFRGSELVRPAAKLCLLETDVSTDVFPDENMGRLCDGSQQPPDGASRGFHQETAP